MNNFRLTPIPSLRMSREEAEKECESKEEASESRRRKKVRRSRKKRRRR